MKKEEEVRVIRVMEVKLLPGIENEKELYRTFPKVREKLEMKIQTSLSLREK